MKNKKCWIVFADEFTRRACLEALDGNAFGSITISDDRREISAKSWETTIGFVQQIRQMGISQGKKMDFRVVVERQKGRGLRYARKSEWIPTCRKQKSLRRTVRMQVSKVKSGQLVRARVGTIF